MKILFKLSYHSRLPINFLHTSTLTSPNPNTLNFLHTFFTLPLPHTLNFPLAHNLSSKQSINVLKGGLSVGTIRFKVYINHLPIMY